ncbi:hypothetical protein GN244_ATG07101 [Phytophthora infestans]|uniref:Uncharacterized protein n=1 Tax=Phytophthora infestans TaxID=4787 RepID=A0A833WLC2_PHYIN|nr:hypothetical protein GN244_ATG07101 [Phytophthora infestans]
MKRLMSSLGGARRDLVPHGCPTVGSGSSDYTENDGSSVSPHALRSLDPPASFSPIAGALSPV